MDRLSGWLTAGAFAALCGTTKETLRHYRDLGLLVPVRRGENGDRKSTRLNSSHT